VCQIVLATSNKCSFDVKRRFSYVIIVFACLFSPFRVVSCLCRLVLCCVMTDWSCTLYLVLLCHVSWCVLCCLVLSGLSLCLSSLSLCPLFVSLSLYLLSLLFLLSLFLSLLSSLDLLYHLSLSSVSSILSLYSLCASLLSLFSLFSLLSLSSIFKCLVLSLCCFVLSVSEYGCYGLTTL
jgi:hypothetical protein